MDKDRRITVAIMLRHIGNRGGITVYTKNLLENIFKIDQYNRYILLFSSKDYTGLYKRFPNVKEIVVRSWKCPAGLLIWDQWQILKHIANEYVDIVFNPKLSVPLFARHKTIFTMHGLEQFAAKNLFLWWDRLYFSFFMKFYCRKADAIIVMTETGKKDLQKYLQVTSYKIHVIPESYNEICKEIRDPLELKRVKDKLKLPARFMLFIGGIAPLKNISTLLKAFRIVKNRGFAHNLVIAGFKRFGYTEDMKQIEKLGLRADVIELGFVDDEDVPALYNLADCFVLPSFYEGFGIPILEAQACKCPVIVGERGAMKEVAGEGGACSFNPDSPEELAEEIELVLTNEKIRSLLIEHGLENVKKYSWENTARKTVQLFKSLII